MKNRQEFMIPIGQFVVDALIARGLTTAAAARLLDVPVATIPALRKGLVELRESSIRAVESEFDEPWATFVVSTLGKPGKLTQDTLRVLDALDAVAPRTRSKRSPRTRARAA